MKIPDPSDICIVVVVQSLSCVQLFVPLGTAAHQAPLSFIISLSLLKFMSIEWVILSNIYPPSKLSPRKRQWHPTPVLLPGKSHGRRGLVGCSPWDFPGKSTGVGCHCLLRGESLEGG